MSCPCYWGKNLKTGVGGGLLWPPRSKTFWESPVSAPCCLWLCNTVARGWGVALHCISQADVGARGWRLERVKCWLWVGLGVTRREGGKKKFDAPTDGVLPHRARGRTRSIVSSVLAINKALCASDMIALIYDTHARLPGILCFPGILCGFCHLLFLERGATGTKRRAQKRPRKRGGVRQTGREIACRCVQCTIDSCVLPVIDSVRLGGSVAGRTLSMRRLCGEQRPWNILTPIADPCQHTRWCSAGIPAHLCVFFLLARLECSSAHLGLSYVASPCLRGKIKQFLTSRKTITTIPSFCSVRIFFSSSRQQQRGREREEKSFHCSIVHIVSFFAAEQWLFAA